MFPARPVAVNVGSPNTPQRSLEHAGSAAQLRGAAGLKTVASMGAS